MLYYVSLCHVYHSRVAAVHYGWPFLSLPRTLTATSNFEVDGFISISSTSKIWCRRVDGFIVI